MMMINQSTFVATNDKRFLCRR